MKLRCPVSGTWWEDGGVRRTVSQFHEVVGHIADQLGGNRFDTFIRFAGQVSPSATAHE